MSALENKIELRDENGVVRVRIGVDSENGPFLSLNGSDGRERLFLGVDKENYGTLSFRTASGQPTVGIGMSPVHGSGMLVFDAPSETVMALTIVNGKGEIRLDTKEGVFSWPVQES